MRRIRKIPRKVLCENDMCKIVFVITWCTQLWIGLFSNFSIIIMSRIIKKGYLVPTSFRLLAIRFIYTKCQLPLLQIQLNLIHLSVTTVCIVKNWQPL